MCHFLAEENVSCRSIKLSIKMLGSAHKKDF